MNEAVDRVLEQREAMDRGFPAGIVLSGAFHLLIVGAALGAAWLGPRQPLLRVADGIAIPLPPGGGGPLQPDPAPAAAPPVTSAPEPAPPAPEPPPKVIKPPKEEPRKGLPPPDAKKAKPKPVKSVPPARQGGPVNPERTAASGAGGTGTNTATPGLGLIAAPGAGVPDGIDPLGDWYLAGVQRKIWLIWTRQIRSTFSQPIRVSFTILGDGSLEDGSVRVVQSSGVQLLDLAGQRAIFSAAPFTPLPRTYGTNRITIQAVFEPTP
jgi:outer membrane biosynthesis protein TonB